MRRRQPKRNQDRDAAATATRLQRRGGARKSRSQQPNCATREDSYTCMGDLPTPCWAAGAEEDQPYRLNARERRGRGTAAGRRYSGNRCPLPSYQPSLHQHNTKLDCKACRGASHRRPHNDRSRSPDQSAAARVYEDHKASK